MIKSPLHRARRLIWLAVGAFALSVVGTGWLVDRQAALDAQAIARQQSESLARAAETALNRSLLGADLMLSSLSQMPGLLGAEGRPVDPAAAGRLLRDRVDQSLTVRDLVLLDRQGRLLAFADPATGRLGAGVPGDFVAALRSQRAPQLAISAPVSRATTGDKVLFLARPIGSLDESGLLAVAEVAVATLTTLMSPGLAPPGMTITLEDDQGRLLAAVPSHDGLLGRRLDVPPVAVPADGLAISAPDRISGKPAQVSVRPTLYQGLRVTAGISDAAVLAGARGVRQAVLAIGGLFVLLAAAAGWLAQRSVVRLQAAQVEHDRINAALQEALASMDEGFLLWDAQDRVLAWNERYLEMLPHMRGTVERGVDVRRMAEAGVRGMLPDADEAQRRAWVQARIARHRSGGREFVQRRPDGRVISVVERPTATGGLVTVYRDITQATDAAEALERARVKAEAANEAKSRFLATMSHEIRTPLNGILGMNSLLLQSPLDPKQREYAQTIALSGDALLSIVNDVLDMSTLEAGRLALELAPFSPQRLTAEVAQMLGKRADDKGVSLIVDDGEDGAASRQLVGDAARLRQVLLNLVGNAIKFTDRGSVQVTSRFAPLDDQRIEWTVVVRDTGIGIPPQALPHLFERFTQGDTSTSRRFGGSGLGLAICRQLLDLMGGRIEVQSRPDEGSCFTVSVPLREHDTAPSEAVVRPPAAARRAPRRALHILGAEDNPVNQMLMKEMLTRLGHRCDVVDDGAQAVQRVRDGSYDLVLMDIQMPRMDGMQATQAIRALPGDTGRVPIVAVSANVLPEQRRAYLEAGMDDYVAKPVDVARLQHAIEGATIAA
jgi:signal transduction histidine kinase/CheY-like chemotaxis protein